jgi:ATP-dependent Lon protease
MNKILSLEEILGGAEGQTISVIANFDREQLESEIPELTDEEIPILPLRNMMLFPGTLLPVTISRESAQTLLAEAEKTKQV